MTDIKTDGVRAGKDSLPCWLGLTFAYTSRQEVIYPRIRYHCSLPEDVPSLGGYFES